ncbi:MAG TPA: 5'/3'-nucleotidase SurE [Acidimicrobiales bacterium]|nr:5'/3'-nucleotidase SurE [Acidimicrobiales bacterium]
MTNDDGIDAPGIHRLCESLVRGGHTVTVVAPDKDRSGSSASIGRLTTGRGVPVEAADFPVTDARAFRVAGPPGLAVMAACLGAFGPAPDLVVSGINAGLNTGHAILHSGTVGAALTAQTFGVSALAVSVDAQPPWQWDTACALANRALQLLTAEPEGTVYNLNAPARELERVRGLRWATLDHFGAVRLAVAGHERGAVQLELRETGAELNPESDTALVAAGYGTLTRLYGVTAPDEYRQLERPRGELLFVTQPAAHPEPP